MYHKKRVVNKKSAILLLVVVLSFSGAGCTAPENDKSVEIEENFISLTITHNVISDDNFLESDSCILNLKSKDIETVAKIKHNAQFSLTYYDNQANRVYYSTNTDKNRNGGDQLFSYDLYSKQSKQLTDALYAINYIIPMIGGNLFIITAKEGNHNISLGYYNVSIEEFVDLEWDNDFFVSIGRRDPKTNNIYVSGYSNSENYKKLDLFNNEIINEPYGIDNKVYMVSENVHKLVFELNRRYITSFAINGDKLICKTSLQPIGDLDEQVLIYNLTTKKISIKDKLLIPGDIFHIDKRGENVYINTGNEILKMNLSSGESETLYKVDPIKSWINNAQLLNY